jgi:hypothetical protein
MSGVLNLLLAGAASAIKDAYYNLTTLLLNTSSTNGAQNNTFLDSSTNNFTITRNGNTTQGTFTPFSQTGWSNYLGGAGNYFQTPANSASTIVGTLSSTTNLTIECWIYPTAYNSSANFPGLIGDMQATAENNNWSWGITSTGTVMLYWGTGSQVRAYTTNTVSLNTWTHIALNIASGAITMYINGVSQTLTGTTTFSAPSASNNYLVIGQWNNGSGGTGGTSNGLFTGYISNLRVVKASTYTSSFTPSTTPLTAIANTSLLYCQSNRFIDNSSNALAITTGGTPSVQAFSPFAPTAAYDTTVVGGSGYFDGTGDYLNSTITAFGTGNFTIECWVYFTAAVASKGVFHVATATALPGSVTGIALANGSSGGWALYYNNGSQNTTATLTPALNSWVHLAVVRTGTTIRVYVNGVMNQSQTDSANYTNQVAAVGGFFNTSNLMTGYVSGFKVTNTADYSGTSTTTANFTLPTAPPSPTSSILCCNFTNAGIFDSAAKNVLETLGNASVSTTQAKWGTTSMAFDGTGDVISVPSTSVQNLSSGDWTIEGWVNIASFAATGHFIYWNGNTGAYAGIRLGIDTNQKLFFLMSQNGSSWAVNTGAIGNTLATSTWYHLAITRSGTSVKVFVDGVQVGTTYTVTGALYAGTLNYVGAINSSGVSQSLNGYIDDLRITTGYARYVSNFSVPTAALPLQ